MSPQTRSVSEFLTRDGTTLVAPAGMGDLLPQDAAERRALARRILRSFELAGYDLVTPPVFEHAEVVRRGNELFDNRELLRFVEPESGEVAVLRPDITPQIARMIATQLRHRPAPYRLCYEGRVFRRQRGRARSHRQVTQVGVECVGIPGAAGDTEILALLIDALEDVGLRDFRVELSDANLVRAVLEEVPEPLRSAFTDALALKDGVTLRSLGRVHGVRPRTVRALSTLCACYGEGDVLERAARELKGPNVRAALSNLSETHTRLSALGLGHRVLFDLGETRGWEYYTGLRFSVLVDGPGEALGQGGRYDRLLSRFGMDAPATGFALALGHLQWTLRDDDLRKRPREELRLVVAGGGTPAAAELCARLRAADIVIAVLNEEDHERCLAFARAWGYHGVLRDTRRGLKLLRTSDGTRHDVDAPDARRIRKLITL